jgi:two-component system, LytTR family, sensor kinase
MRSRWMWVIVAAFWTLDGVVYAIGSYDAVPDFGHELVRSLILHQLWIPYTIAAIELTLRFPVGRHRLARHLAIHAAIAVVVVVTRPMLFVATHPWLEWWPTVPSWTRLLLNSVRFNLMYYVFIVGAAHAVYFALRARERERAAERLAAQLTAARLDALRAQLRPHFLFNALGGIAELVHRDPAAADRMLVRLARLLRLALDDGDAHVVSLAHELDCLAPYLELEQMRYGDRLAVVVEVDPAARDAQVPGLLLQPIVENAIRHGIAPRRGPGTVTIRARRAADAGAARLELEIEDDGVGVPAGTAPGLGLRNTRERLAELYGAAAELAIDGAPGRGTRVRIAVPQGAGAGAGVGVGVVAA